MQAAAEDASGADLVNRFREERKSTGTTMAAFARLHPVVSTYDPAVVAAALSAPKQPASQATKEKKDEKTGEKNGGRRGRHRERRHGGHSHHRHGDCRQHSERRQHRHSERRDGGAERERRHSDRDFRKGGTDRPRDRQSDHRHGSAERAHPHREMRHFTKGGAERLHRQSDRRQSDHRYGDHRHGGAARERRHGGRERRRGGADGAAGATAAKADADAAAQQADRFRWAARLRQVRHIRRLQSLNLSVSDMAKPAEPAAAPPIVALQKTSASDLILKGNLEAVANAIDKKTDELFELQTQVSGLAIDQSAHTQRLAMSASKLGEVLLRHKPELATDATEPPPQTRPPPPPPQTPPPPPPRPMPSAAVNAGRQRAYARK